MTNPWIEIMDLPDEDYVSLRKKAEQNLLMRGSDDHTWGIVRHEMIKIWREKNDR